MLHVLPGNSFLAAARAWVDGIVTGSVNLLKPAAAGAGFLARFLDSVVERDDSGLVSRSTALLDLPREAAEVVEALKAGVDGVAVWGGVDAVRAYRDGLPPTARLLLFGPKLSLAWVTRRGLEGSALPRLAEALARDEGFLRASRGDLNWTVIVEPARDLEGSPLHRTLRIAAYEAVEEPLAWLKARRGWV